MHRIQSESGFSIAELLIATGLLLVISGIVTSALLQITNQQQTIFNRTEMHSGVRGATELLQQEVGQAGRAALPGTVWIASNPVTGILVSAIACQSQPVTLNSVAGIWFDAGGNTAITLTFLGTDPEMAGNPDATESVKITALNVAAKSVTGCFWHNHPAGAPVIVLGAFANGIIPDSGVLNGSTANKLKLFGDINGDGNMVYIEYYCDNGDPGTDGSFNLYRNSMAFDLSPASSKPTLDDSKILLSNVHPNPPDASGNPRPCFQYQHGQPDPIVIQGTNFTFVVDVAVTLTVWTQTQDAITKQFQTETKALLNVSPRNVFSAWEMASLSFTDKIQSTPLTVTNLLP